MLSEKEIINLLKPYQHKKLILKPYSSALMIIDMQNDFLDSKSPSYTEQAKLIIPNIQALLKTARQFKIPVIYTAHCHYDPQIDGGMTAFWWDEIKTKKTLIWGTKGVEIVSELRPQPKEKIIYKHRYSAFYNTELEIYLRGLKVTDLIITGIMTEICVESTVRDAFFRDYRIFVVADATAAGTEELHINSLKVMAYGFAHITTTKAVITNLKRYLKSH
jgi:ureidoacrylate peracid hydrolase